MPRVKYSIKNVYYAPEVSPDIYDETPVALPGAKSTSLEPTGEVFECWADGVLYYKSNGTSGYSGNVTMVYIPDSFRTDILGETLDSKNVLVEKNNSESKKFALGFDIETDTGIISHWFYGVTASRISITANSKEKSMNVDTDVINISIDGLKDGTIRCKTTEETDSEVKTNWYKSVYMPQPGMPMTVSKKGQK